MSKKTFIALVATIIIILIGGISFYFYKQNTTSNQAQNQSQTTQSPNANQPSQAPTPTTPALITYKNPLFPNFSFDYPSSYKLDFKYPTVSPAENAPITYIQIIDSANQEVMRIQFEYEGFGGAGFGCWPSKQDNPKQYVQDISKNWNLVSDLTSNNSRNIFILKSDFFTKGTQQFNDAIAFNNDQAGLNNESKLDPSKIIGCESSHGFNFTKTTFSDPTAPNQDPNRLASVTIESSTKPSTTKELSDILDSIKGLEAQNQPVPTVNQNPETKSTSVASTTDQTATKLSSNDVLDERCDKYTAKIGEKIQCKLAFVTTTTQDQIPLVKYSLVSPAGSQVNLGSILSVCVGEPLTENAKRIGSLICTFDTKAAKAGVYTTSIDINNDVQLGVTDNITLTK